MSLSPVIQYLKVKYVHSFCNSKGSPCGGLTPHSKAVHSPSFNVLTPKDTFKVFSATIQPQFQDRYCARSINHRYFHPTCFGIISPHGSPSSVSVLFDRLNAPPELATRLNATYTKRGVFKTAGLTNVLADQKTDHRSLGYQVGEILYVGP